MRALVVGYGRMGTFHAKVLRDLGFDVCAVDPDPARGADYAHAIDAEPWTWDAAAVAVPMGSLTGAALIVRDLSLHAIPMLVEKPFAFTTEGAEALADLLPPARTCVGYVERFNPQVRKLREAISGQKVFSAHFTRWSDRPSWNVALDLQTHDIDLARHLGVLDVATFDTRADMPEKVRTIEVVTADGTHRADLMAHTTSPLHALWHTFLMGGDVPTPADAVEALRYLETASAVTSAH